MRTIIAVDWDTMKEFADEEARVCAEGQDWFGGENREEAIRRVVKRRGDPKMLRDLEERHRACVRASKSIALKTAEALDRAEGTGGYIRGRDPRLDQLMNDAISALDTLGLYIIFHDDYAN